jgi:hypothetical protein
MINNEDLFDHFRTARRRGYRSGWTAPVNRRVAQVVSVFTIHEPPEYISETSVLDPEREFWSGTVECPYCGHTLDRLDTVDGETCYPCDSANRAEWPDTVAAIKREEYAMR